jgi:S-adenosylmethionine:tRNA ribosyltransferase-isomerase
MATSGEQYMAAFQYELPEELIRKQGVEPRDSARLFVYDTKTDTITLDTFKNVAEYIPEATTLVMNNTRVVPARLWLTKETGGKIEVFVLMNELEDETRIPVLVDRKVMVGQKLFFPNQAHFLVEEQEENRFYVSLQNTDQTLREILDECGQTPLPHYLEGDEPLAEEDLRERYQAVFAKKKDGASVAAPTASLHFTEAVFASLKEKHIEPRYLMLDVGLGTFAPLKEQNFTSGKLHPERVTVTTETLERLTESKAAGRPVLAVGTTVARSLESLAKEGRHEAGTFVTDIFILPGYQFRNVDMLMTNFHLPQSSLMFLVEAFLQHKKAKRGIVELYQEAIREGFSFYSFGDSMLIV